MTFQNRKTVFVLFLFALTEVVSWTIDLPEVRKHFFEHHERHKARKMEKIDIDYKEMEDKDQEFYSNIEGNSKHNTVEHKMHDSHEEDSDEYDQSYMEKKVQNLVNDGGLYLEGLRLALEDFIRLIEDCNRNNMAMSQDMVFAPPVMPSRPNMTVTTMFNTTMPPFPSFNTSDWPMSMGQRNFTGSSTNRTRARMSCREATEASEKVRQFANLAIWATKRLQDLSYARMYQKTDYYEENELILKLAWFLDQLAILTGYEPNYRRYKPVKTTPIPTTSPMPITLVPQNQELIKNLVTCMKSHSALAAPERCRYTPPQSDSTPETSTTSSPQMDSTMITSSPADSVTAQSMELLITGDANRTPRRITKRSTHGHEYFVPIGVHEKPKPVVDFFVKKLSNLKAIVKSVKKNALADFSTQLALHKHIHKRAIDDKMSMYAVLNRLSNALRDKSNDKSIDPSVKNEVPTVKSDGLSVKNDKSVVKSNLPAVKSGDVIVVAPIHYPVSDVSVVNTKSFKKRSISDNSYLIDKLTNSPVTAAVKSVKKRSVHDPLDKFASFYLKYKAWDGSNQIITKNNNSPTNYDVSNSLQTKILTKRSIFHKKNSHFKIFKPLQMFKPYKKYSIKKGKSKLLSYMNDILKKKLKFSQKSLHKIYKRSLHYERMYLPRIPTDPTGDISYYAKNKRGRMYNPNLVQAGLLRLSLERTFANGNIAVIQRYGSNYNPAVPDAFNAGVLRSAADS